MLLKKPSIIDVVANDTVALVLRAIRTAPVNIVGIVAVLAGVAAGAGILEAAQGGTIATSGSQFFVSALAVCPYFAKDCDGCSRAYQQHRPSQRRRRLRPRDLSRGTS